MNYTHHNVLYGYTMAEHRIMAFPNDYPCRVVVLVIPLILRCLLIEKVTQLPVIYKGMGLKRNDNSV